MELYAGTSSDFLKATAARQLAPLLARRFLDQYRFPAPDSEVRAWTNSLEAAARVVETAGLYDHGVLVEYQLPLTSRRLDLMLTGRKDADDHAVIVELKQWEYVRRSDVDECVRTLVGMQERDVLHPSAQVGSYRDYLADTNSAVAEVPITVDSCAYLHNLYQDRAAELFDTRHRSLLDTSPSFVRGQEDDLAGYLVSRLASGRGEAVLERFESGRFRPTKRLLEETARVIQHEPAWILLDEQRVALNAVLTKVGHEPGDIKRHVFLVSGGPGTGKSVVAINLVAALADRGLAALHATGSRAFTENLRKAVGRRSGALFKYFNSFQSASPGEIDVLILDEAHRLRERSWTWRTPYRLRTDATQLEELLRASKVAVFLIDDLQVVRPGEVGNTRLIKRTAEGLGIPVSEYRLDAQFRCGGSDEFIAWVDNTLGIRRTASVLWNTDEEFEFRVVASPRDLVSWVHERSRKGTARFSAGFCWPWSDPRPDGTLINDVRVDGLEMPWNAKPDAARLALGIPKSNHWATDPAGIGQVGCIYTAQGFEYDFSGVIVGRDLVHRDEKGWVGQPEYSHDQVVRRVKDPAEFTTLVKNAYRVLLTRGLKGCAVWFEDEPTAAFVRSRLETSIPR